ncbi:MAG TPA: MBL fold metallo-hydrolase [Chryseolinea sp.]|nr:MBL fold metallo-hydrolase [Chryseolinea sp.]HPH46514.1 MBL fold metallo-hydrolase [Chryseolinea sp.]HPM29551.1 MBL fold metallo-hydrolase [Chryseolinea sp.]
MKNFLALCLILNCLNTFAQHNFDTVKIRTIQVTESIYMLVGSGGNIGIMIGKDGTLMIDNQFAPLSNKINGAIKTLDPAEIRFVINTHLHGDHSGGNENFTEMGSTVVAHDLVRERMKQGQVTPQMNRTTPPREGDALPVITFSDRLNFHLNDEEIELIHFDPGHTDGDVIVKFKNANVFHTGDTYVRHRFPFIDLSSGGTFAGYISTLDKMLLLMNDQSKIIPGHGELSSKADIKKYRDQLVDMRDLIFKALKKGKKVEEITSLGISDKYEAELGKNMIKGKDFVLLVAEELKASMPATK